MKLTRALKFACGIVEQTNIMSFEVSQVENRQITPLGWQNWDLCGSFQENYKYWQLLKFNKRIVVGVLFQC